MGQTVTAGPVKRSVSIAGHSTSITLEAIFWDALLRAAGEEGLPLNALVARIDAERASQADLPNLASAIRVWLFSRALERAGPAGSESGGHTLQP
jgi:predicted DNA-binding ribbon-helix-helix protein